MDEHVLHSLSGSEYSLIDSISYITPNYTFSHLKGYTSISDAYGWGVATGETTIMISKKSLQMALLESLVAFPPCNLRQRFNNGHITVWQSRPFCHACILWALLQYRATLQTLHFSMCASFGQVWWHVGNVMVLVSRFCPCIPWA